MADYTTNRSAERFTYRRVSWSTWAETGTYDNITGGNVSCGAYTTLKTSAQLNYAGTAPDTTDLVRIYYSFTDGNGARSEEHALGTFLVGFDTVGYTPGNGSLIQTGTVTGYSVLKVLQDRLCGLPLTIPAGTDPIAYAKSLITTAGLRANVQANATYSLANPHTFEPTDSWLTVVNWCLSNCPTQYAAATVDGYGVVQVQPYQEPTSRTPAWTFADDEHSIMQPAVSEQNEWQTAANVVRLYYEDETTAMWASASNDSGSRTSLDRRGGRETTYYEQVDECASLADLQALAVSRLKDRAAEIERVNLLHAFVPLAAGDPVAVAYADRTWTGTVQNLTIALAPSAQCTTQLRRYASAAISVTVDGATLWTA